jgi:hypothetical protein
MKCSGFLAGLGTFLALVRESDSAFEREMSSKLPDKDMTFCEWFEIWLAWNELGELEDCKRQYWQDGYD